MQAVVGHGCRSSPHARRSDGSRPEPGAGRPTRDLARECADAWAACSEAGSQAGHNPRLLARALLHAAAGDLRRLARSGSDEADAVVLAAARAFFLLRIAVRKGAYDPGMPGEVLPAAPAALAAGGLGGRARARRARGLASPAGVPAQSRVLTSRALPPPPEFGPSRARLRPHALAPVPPHPPAGQENDPGQDDRVQAVHHRAQPRVAVPALAQDVAGVSEREAPGPGAEEGVGLEAQRGMRAMPAGSEMKVRTTGSRRATRTAGPPSGRRSGRRGRVAAAHQQVGAPALGDASATRRPTS